MWHLPSAATITKTTIVNNVSTVFARLFGAVDKPAISKAGTGAVNRAYAVFARDNQEWVAALFDKESLLAHGSDVIAGYLQGLQSGPQAAAELARRWDLLLGPAKTTVRSRRIADVTSVAERFLRLMAAGDAAEEADDVSADSDGGNPGDAARKARSRGLPAAALLH